MQFLTQYRPESAEKPAKVQEYCIGGAPYRHRTDKNCRFAGVSSVVGSLGCKPVFLQFCSGAQGCVSLGTENGYAELSVTGRRTPGRSVAG
jgi:hypothetical protein